MDRTKLYGFIDVEALDSKNRKCTLATLADDGRTIVGTGGSSFAVMSPDGEWLERSALKAVDREGKPVVPVGSSYAGPVIIKHTATIDEYLSHNIKNIYMLNPQGQVEEFIAELKRGTIFQFPYSFRGGLEADAGFVLAGADGGIFFCVGQPTNIHFLGLEQLAAPVDDDEGSGEEDSMDFGMM